MGKFLPQYQEELSPQQKKYVLDGLAKNAQNAGIHKEIASFSFVISNEKQEVIAAISGGHYFGCFYIELLFVNESERGKGYGSSLLEHAEQLARERECLFITLNTMDFEARPFYEKHGYQLEFVRDGYENGTKAYFLRKEL